MSDRIAVMNRGVIEQIEGPEEVYERPRTTFVAGFIGVSNLMPGEVVSANGEQAELRLDSGVTVNTDSRGASAGERAHAVVRPEKLELRPLDEPADPGRPAVRGNRGELALPRHGHSVRGPPGGLHRHDGPRAELGRVGSPPAAGCGRSSSTGLGERAHPHRARGGGPRRSAHRICKLLSGLIEGEPVPRKPTTDFERRLDRMMRGELTRRRLLRQGAAGALSVSAHRLPRRLRRRRALRAGPGGDEGDREGRDLHGAHLRELAALHRRRRQDRGAADAPGVREEVRHEGQVRRGGQRQRRVLRQGPPGVRQRQLGRPRRPRGHGLDGGEDEAPRLRPEVRQVGDAERHQEHRGRGCEPGLRPQARVLDAVAVGPDGADLPQGPRGRGPDELQRPLRPEVQGQGHVPVRDARLGRAPCCSATA